MITLIEYAAFCGSVNIFKYLYLNKVELTSSLWYYTIHGQNSELIHFLEEMQICPPKESYNECLLESIKCNHNEIAEYIQSNFIDENETNEISCLLKSYNYEWIPNDINNDFDTFYCLCKYDYFYVVQFLLKEKAFDINAKKVLFLFISFLM